MKQRSLLALTSLLCVLASGCNDENPNTDEINQDLIQDLAVTQAPLTSVCTINVNGVGTISMEDDYVPHVVFCEIGAGEIESLKAQAVAARSIGYFFQNVKGYTVNSPNDQVYSDPTYCANPSGATLDKLLKASHDTNGIVLQYQNQIVVGYYVSGAKPEYLQGDCTYSGSSGSTGWVNPQRFATYNWNKSGTSVVGRPEGDPGTKGYVNRGCLSQNGATCLARNGWVWENILRWAYGMDVEFTRTQGSCITHPQCTTRVKNGTVIDDTNECFTREASPQWYLHGAGNSNNSQYAYTTAGSSSGYGKWAINAESAGKFKISAYIDGSHGTRSKKAPYTIRANGKNTAKTVDISGSGWITIGTFDLAQGGDQWIRLDNNTGEAFANANSPRVVFDAIKFEAVACTNQCTTNGAKQCSNNGVQTCKDTNGDGCLEWSTAVACSTNQTCSNGACVDKCTNKCTTNGAKQCSNNGVQTCKDTNGDGCLEWSTAVACGTNQTCSNGACVDKCTNKCTTNGAKQCSNNGVQTCKDTNGDGCLEWSTAVACGSNQSCSNGACVDKCTNECTEGKTLCNDDHSMMECGQFDDDECLEWSAPIQCGEGEFCFENKCSPFATDTPIETPALPDNCELQIDGRPSTIIDNEDPCFVANDASKMAYMKGYGYDKTMYYAYIDGNSSKITGTWHLNVTKSGQYAIYAILDGSIGNIVNSQFYSVKASDKDFKPFIKIDETTQRVKIGTYTLTAGMPQFVELSNLMQNGKDGQRIVWDAIEVIPSELDTGESDIQIGDPVKPEEPEIPSENTDPEDPSLAYSSSGCSMTTTPASSAPLWMLLTCFAGIAIRRRRSAK